MTGYLLIFVAGFGSVFLMGFQSRNVAHGNYTWAALTSFAIALAQSHLWNLIGHDTSFLTSLVYGLSGMCGITLSIYTHKRMSVREPRKDWTRAFDEVDYTGLAPRVPD